MGKVHRAPLSAINLVNGIHRIAIPFFDDFVLTPRLLPSEKEQIRLLWKQNDDDLIVVEREDGASVFHRPNAVDFESWLEDYSVGELWEKNVLGKRPE